MKIFLKKGLYSEKDNTSDIGTQERELFFGQPHKKLNNEQVIE